MAKDIIKKCVVCGMIFATIDPVVDACSSPCARTLSQRIKQAAKQSLSNSEFAAKLGREERDYWRFKLRAFRLKHHLRLREMAFLLGMVKGEPRHIVDIEGGRVPMPHARRAVLMALDDGGYRPPNWPKGERKPRKQNKAHSFEIASELLTESS